MAERNQEETPRKQSEAPTERRHIPHLRVGEKIARMSANRMNRLLQIALREAAQHVRTA